jgi:hypothetical protein
MVRSLQEITAGQRGKDRYKEHVHEDSDKKYVDDRDIIFVGASTRQQNLGLLEPYFPGEHFLQWRVPRLIHVCNY